MTKPKQVNSQQVGCISSSEANKELKALSAVKDQEGVLRRERADCKRLAKQVSRLALKHDLTPAEVGQLTRATEGLHKVERIAYGLDRQQSKAPAVFLIPVAPKTIEEWAKGAQALIPPSMLPKHDPHEGKHIEDQIQGQVPADFEDVPPDGDQEGSS